jgi:hypothetical protein
VREPATIPVRRLRTGLCVALLASLLWGSAGIWEVGAEETVSGAAQVRPATIADTAALRFLQIAEQEDLASAGQGAAAAVAEQGLRYWLPELAADAPDWAKRIAWDFDWSTDDKPEFSVFTVQPLYQSPDRLDTVFTQLRLASLHQFSDHRIAQNVGLGYRRVLADGDAMLGANAFHDYEWDYHPSRASVGLEGRWGPVDVFMNAYWGISGSHTVATDTTEKPLDGRDIEIALQVPYLPWAKARGRYFEWDAADGPEDIDGIALSLDADLHQNLQLEIGAVDDNTTDWEGFMKLRVRVASWNGVDRPVALSDRIVDDAPFAARDMRDHALDEVRRENKIILERSSAGITISRGT